MKPAERLVLDLGRAMADGVRAMSRQWSVTPNAFAQACFVLALRLVEEESDERLVKSPSGTSSTSSTTAITTNSVYWSQLDAVHGTTTSGRSAPVKGIQSLVAPLVRSFPVRVRSSKHRGGRTTQQETVCELAKSLHEQLTESLEHEHCDLSDIQKVVLGTDTDVTRNLFNVLFDFEPEEQTLTLGEGIAFQQTATIDAIGMALSIRVSYGDTMVVMLTSEQQQQQQSTDGTQLLPNLSLLSARYQKVLEMVTDTSSSVERQLTVLDVRLGLYAANLSLKQSCGNNHDQLVQETGKVTTRTTSRPMLPIIESIIESINVESKDSETKKQLEQEQQITTVHTRHLTKDEIVSLAGTTERTDMSSDNTPTATLLSPLTTQLCLTLGSIFCHAVAEMTPNKSLSLPILDVVSGDVLTLSSPAPPPPVSSWGDACGGSLTQRAVRHRLIFRKDTTQLFSTEEFRSSSNNSNNNNKDDEEEGNDDARLRSGRIGMVMAPSHLTPTDDLVLTLSTAWTAWNVTTTSPLTLSSSSAANSSSNRNSSTNSVDIKVRLICFPFAGGDARAFDAFVQSLPSWIEAVVVEYPGHGTRRSEPLCSDTPSLVRAIFPSLRSAISDGSRIPYAILGYSVGALVAMETCEHVSRLGLPAPCLVIPVGAAAPTTWKLGVDPALPNEDFVHALRDIGEITDAAVEAGPAAWDMLLGPYRSDLHVEKSFVAAEQQRQRKTAAEQPLRQTLACPILCVVADGDVGVVDNYKCWKDETNDTLIVQTVPGEHMFLRDVPESRDIISVRLVSLLLERLSVSAAKPQTELLEFDSLVQSPIEVAHVLSMDEDGGGGATISLVCHALPSKEIDVLREAYETGLGLLLGLGGKSGKIDNDVAVKVDTEIGGALPLGTKTNVAQLPLLQEPFWSHVATAPKEVAVVDVNGVSNAVEWTYSDMGSFVNAVSTAMLAHLTSIDPTQPDVVISIIMHKGWEQVVSALAVLTCHATYLPIDAKWPSKRAKQIIEASGTCMVLTLSHLMEDVDRKEALKDVPVVLVDQVVKKVVMNIQSSERITPSSTTFAIPANHPWSARPTPSPRDMAYLIYTSGSTGTPKGVRCHHQGAMNTNMDLIERFDITQEDRVLGLSSLSFDLSVFDVFAMSASTGALVLSTSRSEAGHVGTTGPDPEEWLRLVEEHHVTVWNAVPAFMELLVNHAEQIGRRLPSCLRLVMMSGDWIPPTLPERIHRLSTCDSMRVISLGGATEAAIWSNMYEIKPGWRPSEKGWSCIPYGRPLRNQTMYILDDATMEHCERWVTGVIYIGGAGVALGYHKNPEKTKRQFVLHPRTGEYLFRTGDLGRLRSNGELEILGREDSQVKVNGYRIELGEIEKLAAGHANAMETCAVVSTAAASPQIVLYVTCRGSTELELCTGTVNDANNDATAVKDAEAVSEWSRVYDAVYTQSGAGEEEDNTAEDTLNHESMDTAATAAVIATDTEQDEESFDLAGWTNSYTGEPLPAEEMREWLDETVSSILQLNPSRVLEIGFGTGMILHALLHDARSNVKVYRGTDISEEAVLKVRKHRAKLTLKE